MMMLKKNWLTHLGQDVNKDQDEAIKEIFGSLQSGKRPRPPVELRSLAFVDILHQSYVLLLDNLYETGRGAVAAKHKVVEERFRIWGKMGKNGNVKMAKFPPQRSPPPTS